MKNHLGETIYCTYSGWRAAIRKKWGNNIVWDGNKDICSAFVNNKSLGQWDGAEGFIINT